MSGNEQITQQGYQLTKSSIVHHDHALQACWLAKSQSDFNLGRSNVSRQGFDRSSLNQSQVHIKIINSPELVSSGADAILKSYKKPAPGLKTEQSFIDSTQESFLAPPVARKTQKVDLGSRVITSPSCQSLGFTQDINNSMLITGYGGVGGGMAAMSKTQIWNQNEQMPRSPSQIAEFAKKHPQVNRQLVTHFHQGNSVDKSRYCSPQSLMKNNQLTNRKSDIAPLLGSSVSMATIPLKVGHSRLYKRQNSNH